MSDPNGNESVINGDLIDLNASTPIFHDAPLVVTGAEPVSDNLIDTELPLLEQKLQVASTVPPKSSTGYAVDVEDILITLDDDHPEDGERPDYQAGKVLEDAEPCDNIEALAILTTLDQVLNASLARNATTEEDESEDGRNSVEECCVDEQTQRYIEDCLLDLDDYLKRYESSNCEDCQGEDLSCATKSSGCDRSECLSDASSVEDLSERALDGGDEEPEAGATNRVVVDGAWAQGSNGDGDVDDDGLREKLRQIEENYAKFLASGCANRSRSVEEESAGDKEAYVRRPSSACGTVGHEVGRGQPGRSTVAAVRGQGRRRPLARQGAVSASFGQRRGSDPAGEGTRAGRTSGAPAPPSDAATGGGDCSDEDIDWSWVHDVAGAGPPDVAATQSTGDVSCWPLAESAAVSQERLAHAAGDCCTGAVVVEAPPASASAPEDVAAAGKASDGGAWLRDSMRRLRRFPLPSDGDPRRPLEAADAAPPPVADGMQQATRPVSAPSRLPASEDAGRSRSRSRSDDSFHSAVSHVPAGRARSSSASSRSRRRRSLSSSGSSVASSGDTSASCTPTPAPEQAAGADGRRFQPYHLSRTQRRQFDSSKYRLERARDTGAWSERHNCRSKVPPSPIPRQSNEERAARDRDGCSSKYRMERARDTGAWSERHSSRSKYRPERARDLGAWSVRHNSRSKIPSSLTSRNSNEERIAHDRDAGSYKYRLERVTRSVRSAERVTAVL